MGENENLLLLTIDYGGAQILFKTGQGTFPERSGVAHERPQQYIAQRPRQQRCASDLLSLCGFSDRRDGLLLDKLLYEDSDLAPRLGDEISLGICTGQRFDVAGGVRTRGRVVPLIDGYET